jgi:hypothetical protein
MIVVKYMILLYGSQRDYDLMTGNAGDGAPVSPEEFEPMFAFMESWTKGLVDSGEHVDAHGLVAPVHTRRVELRDGSPVVTDGPYAETQEVLAGYNVVECDSFDRATQIAVDLVKCPYPAAAGSTMIADVRPLADGVDELPG